MQVQVPLGQSMSNSQSTLKPLKVYSAHTFYLRLRGLLGRRELETNEALHIQPCSDVHTFGMKYDLDIVFLDSAGSVLKVDSLRPNRWSYCKGAKAVLEFKAGCALLHGYELCSAKSKALNNNKIFSTSIGERT